MLEPKEIDNYFNTAVLSPKDKERQLSGHTRRVMLAKLALPGLAAVLAVTLLAFPYLKKDIKEFGLDFTVSKGDIEKLNIEKTTIYITDKDNRVNNFIAENIKETSAGSKQFLLTAPEAIIPLNNDEWSRIKSPSGLYDQQQNLLRLQPQAEVFFSRGMTIQTEEAFFDFKTSRGWSHEPVTGSGFIGNLSADGFEISGQKSTLTFLGKTHIIINEETLQKE